MQSPRPVLLVVGSTFPAGAHDGTPAFIRDLSEELAKAFDVTVLVPRVPRAAPNEEFGRLHIVRFAYFLRRWEDLADGAIIENLRSKRSRWIQVPFFFVCEFIAMRRLVRRLKPAAMHVHWMIPQGIVASLAARRTPQLVTTLGGDVYALRDPVSRRLKSRVLRRASAVTTMNSDMRNRLIELGAAAESTRILPMGAQIDEMERFRGSARESTRMLFVGRLVEKKGAAVLIDALGLLTRESDWSLDIVGDGPLRAELEARARPFGGRVRFLGQAGKEVLGQQYATCAMLVMPSVSAASGDQDGLPVTLLEAMALECPVVASDLPGIDDALDHGSAGLLVEPNAPSALASALTLMLNDPALRARYGVAAGARSERYSVQSIGAEYTALLQQIARL